MEIGCWEVGCFLVSAAGTQVVVVVYDGCQTVVDSGCDTDCFHTLEVEC